MYKNKLTSIIRQATKAYNEIQLNYNKTIKMKWSQCSTLEYFVQNKKEMYEEAEMANEFLILSLLTWDTILQKFWKYKL